MCKRYSSDAHSCVGGEVEIPVEITQMQHMNQTDTQTTLYSVSVYFAVKLTVFAFYNF